MISVSWLGVSRLRSLSRLLQRPRLLGVSQLGDWYPLLAIFRLLKRVHLNKCCMMHEFFVPLSPFLVWFILSLSGSRFGDAHSYMVLD